ncbi:MAG: tetratricopeptide repeat protein [Deltaproteobacteria bacterium]|nr:tetratricopeptide repeat protein [Deltaproteobacteria bacterium]MCB2186330.1 tetratricopeptide repeat protein [Deltaproteobacteria bacterium]
MSLRLWVWTVLTGSKFKAIRLEGDMLLKKRRFAQALEFYRAMVRAWPEKPDGFYGMSRTYQAMGLRVEAARDLTIGDALTRLHKDPSDLVSRLQLVAGLVEKGLYGWAAAHAAHALKQAPKDLETLKMAAKAFSKNRNFTKASEALREALRQEPMDVGMYELLTHCLRLAGKQSEAMRTGALAEALKNLQSNPNDPDSVAQAVRQFIAVGYNRMALQLLEKCISQGRADKAELHVMRAQLLREENNYREAIKALTHAVTLSPVYAEAHRMLSEAYFMDNNNTQAEYHRAVATTLEGAQRNPDPLEAEFIMIEVLLEMGHLELAKGRADELHQNNPGDWRALMCLGVVKRHEGLLAEARANLQRANQKNPMSPKLHMELALVYSETGEVLDAVGEARQAVKLAPRNPEVRRSLAEVLRRHGYTDQAIEEDDLADALEKNAKKRQTA